MPAPDKLLALPSPDYFKNDNTQKNKIKELAIDLETYSAVDVTWMADYFSKNHTDKEKEELENVEFAGGKFVNWHAKEYRYHHVSDRAYSMHNDGSFNFLSAEELNTARKEIIENPKRNNTPKSQSKESVKEI